MNLSQKCQYALRGLFELARRHGAGPIRIAEIAEAQAIPPRFLEGILAELKRAGFVASRRGARGGYLLAVPPASLTVGQVIHFVDGPQAPVKCLAGPGSDPCPLRGRCAFMGLWQRAANAVGTVYDATTLQDLLDEQRPAAQALTYSI